MDFLPEQQICPVTSLLALEEVVILLNMVASKKLSKNRWRFFNALLGTFLVLFASSAVPASANNICIRGSKSVPVPSNGQCPKGFKKIQAKAVKKKDCSASELFRLKDLRDAILEAREQVPLWQAERSRQLQAILQAKMSGDYTSASIAQQSVYQAESEIKAWQNSIREAGQEFLAIEAKCKNTAVRKP